MAVLQKKTTHKTPEVVKTRKHCTAIAIKEAVSTVTVAIAKKDNYLEISHTITRRGCPNNRSNTRCMRVPDTTSCTCFCTGEWSHLQRDSRPDLASLFSYSEPFLKPPSAGLKSEEHTDTHKSALMQKHGHRTCCCAPQWERLTAHGKLCVSAVKRMSRSQSRGCRAVGVPGDTGRKAFTTHPRNALSTKKGRKQPLNWVHQPTRFHFLLFDTIEAFCDFGSVACAGDKLLNGFGLHQCALHGMLRSRTVIDL